MKWLKNNQRQQHCWTGVHSRANAIFKALSRYSKEASAFLLHQYGTNRCAITERYVKMFI